MPVLSKQNFSLPFEAEAIALVTDGVDNSKDAMNVWGVSCLGHTITILESESSDWSPWIILCLLWRRTFCR